MNVVLGLAPLLVVILLCTWGRLPAFVAAWFGVALVSVLMVVGPGAAVDTGRVLQGLSAAGVIALQAAFVIVPGLYLNALLGQAKAHDTLVTWVERLPMAPRHKRLMIVLGLAPALESLTGFGVSLLVTVPLLLAISDRSIGLRQSLLSMNIMPWGTLALATVVGAQLGKQPVAALGYYSSLVSFGVFPTLGMMVGWLSAPKTERWQVLFDGLLVGCMLALALVFFNWVGLNELAGVFSGVLCSMGCWFLFSYDRQNPNVPWVALRPYAMALGLIVALRLLLWLGVPLSQWALSTGGVRFAPLTSPGLALLVAVMIFGQGSFGNSMHRQVMQRAIKPILALGGFTLMAQLMVADGMILVLGEVLHSGGSPLLLGVISPLLGSLSGYLTGSNVGGNALMMTMQSSLAEGHLALILGGIQNSSAGHAVFASMPIILLVLAIAGPGAAGEERELLRFALKMLLVVTLALMVIGVVLTVTG